MGLCEEVEVQCFEASFNTSLSVRLTYVHVMLWHFTSLYTA